MESDLPPPIPVAEVKELDQHRSLEHLADVVKRRLGAQHVVISVSYGEASFASFIPNELWDIDLVYMIKSLEDRRRERLP